MFVTLCSFDGHPSDLLYVSTELSQKFPSDVIVHTVDRSWETHEGIDKLGHSVALEVRNLIITSFSV
jgi:hypothetical protein